MISLIKKTHFGTLNKFGSLFQEVNSFNPKSFGYILKLFARESLLLKFNDIWIDFVVFTLLPSEIERIDLHKSDDR